jgi:ABC-2 type transport system ATP-binding protein
VEQVAGLPGVLRARATDGSLEVVAAEPAPLLPKLLAACAEFGAEPTAIDLDQPTLERVFLHLTGRGLRD